LKEDAQSIDMDAKKNKLHVRFAETEDDIRAVQRLRYHVFVKELGARIAGADHLAGLEVDSFDPFSDHLMLLDQQRPENDRVVGVYRLMDRLNAAAAGAFSCEAEFDIAEILKQDRPVLELSRSCLHPEYRNGMGMFLLWQALARHIDEQNIAFLFGVASYHGTDIAEHADSLSLLSAEHLSSFNVTSHQNHKIPPRDTDRKVSLRKTPALIKAYLRLGGKVGKGVFVDETFNTTDVCMIVDTSDLNEKQKALFTS